MTIHKDRMRAKLAMASIENTNLLQQNLDIDKRIGELQDFLMRLAEKGGTIVSSNDCSVSEITLAQACKRFLVIDSLGFVYRPKPTEEK